MTFHVTESAAEFISAKLPKQGRVVARMSLQEKKGCGDKSLAVTPSVVMSGDSIVRVGELLVVANLDEYPELEGATLDLETEGLNKLLVLRSEKLSVCGCGLSYATEKK